MSQAQRRLLDLLAGWQHFVTKCAESEEPHPGVSKEQYEREAELIAQLYQDVGSVEDMRRSAVFAAVVRIVELITRGDGVDRELASKLIASDKARARHYLYTLGENYAPDDPPHAEDVDALASEFALVRELTRVGSSPASAGPRWTISAYLVRDDHVLLVRHKALEMWLPIGGGIETGERPCEAVLREVREETGFTIDFAPDGIECLGFDEHVSGERIHMNLAHRARVLMKSEPRSDGSWDEYVWLRIGAKPPASTPKNVREVLQRLAKPGETTAGKPGGET